MHFKWTTHAKERFLERVLGIEPTKKNMKKVASMAERIMEKHPFMDEYNIPAEYCDCGKQLRIIMEEDVVVTITPFKFQFYDSSNVKFKKPDKMINKKLKDIK